jgi:mannose-6-phosphate isomerase
VVPLVTCQYFNTSLIHFNKEIKRDYSSLYSFVIYVCTEGSLILKTGTIETIVKKGDCVLLPAEIKKVSLVPEKESKLLEVYIV